MVQFQKLKYPLNRTTLNAQDGIILLAYDIIWRWRESASISHLQKDDGLALLHDTEANLMGLEAYIKHTIPDGAERFEV